MVYVFVTSLNSTKDIRFSYEKDSPDLEEEEVGVAPMPLATEGAEVAPVVPVTAEATAAPASEATVTTVAPEAPAAPEAPQE